MVMNLHVAGFVKYRNMLCCRFYCWCQKPTAGYIKMSVTQEVGCFTVTKVFWLMDTKTRDVCSMSWRDSITGTERMTLGSFEMTSHHSLSQYDLFINFIWNCFFEGEKREEKRRRKKKKWRLLVVWRAWRWSGVVGAGNSERGFRCKQDGVQVQWLVDTDPGQVQCQGPTPTPARTSHHIPATLPLPYCVQP